MLSKRIIPCLDIDKGRVVKGTNFVDIRDAGDPLELAKKYDRDGADELVFLDITASSDDRGILIDLVKRTAEQLFIPFTVGGGIRSVETMRELLLAGADKVSVNSAAVARPELLREGADVFGAQCIVLALDVKTVSGTPELVHQNEEIALDATSQWEIVTHGGRKKTGIDAVKWAAYGQKMGAGELLVTSMDHDGAKTGYALELLRAIGEVTSIPVIASGGAGTTRHISDALTVCDAALLASLLHFGELSIEEIKAHCQSENLPIRNI